MLELLAPAGSMEALRAAVQNGANAVYLGVGPFNARQGARNFTLKPAGGGCSTPTSGGCSAFDGKHPGFRPGVPRR